MLVLATADGKSVACVPTDLAKLLRPPVAHRLHVRHRLQRRERSDKDWLRRAGAGSVGPPSVGQRAHGVGDARSGIFDGSGSAVSRKGDAKAGLPFA